MAFWFAVHLEAASRAMWISAWTGRPAYAALHSTGRLLWIPFWIWITSRGVIGGRFQGPGMGLLLFLAPLLCIGAFGSFSRRGKLREKLAREIALDCVRPGPHAWG